MMRHLRSMLLPVLCLLIAVGGVSYGLTSNQLGFSTASTESEEVPPATDVLEDVEAPETVSQEQEEGDGDEDSGPASASEAAERRGPPEGKGPVWSTEGCPEGFSGNHGQYVSSSKGTEPRDDAAHSPCGKPVHEDDEGENEEESDDGEGSAFGQSMAEKNRPKDRPSPPGPPSDDQ